MIVHSLRLPLLTMLMTVFMACGQQEGEREIAIGVSAPNFKATLPGEVSFELKQLQGKYILLDFWGSWCAPCRKDHPALVDIYRQFSKHTFAAAEGFEIVSVAIETDSSSWQKAIEKDQLPWPYQIMELTDRLNKVNVPIAQTYKIKKVPARFLINEKGVIVGVNPGPEAVRTYLNTK